MGRRWPEDRRGEMLSSRACFAFAGVFALLAAGFGALALHDEAGAFDRVLAVAWLGIVIAWIFRGVVTRRRESRSADNG